MLGLYNLVLPALIAAARVAALFNAKIRRGLRGRVRLSGELKAHYDSHPISGKRILIHAASYGELEQAKPVIQRLRSEYPGCHIHLTFFSPSGYENTVGKYRDVDLITYSPFDSKSEVRRFLEIARPDLALFTRYDVWPNMAMELRSRRVPTVLFSATAAEESKRTMPFAKTLHAEIYRSLTKIFAISESDRSRFLELGIEPSKVEVAGDTRFDQVVLRKLASTQSPLPDFLVDRIERKGTLVFVAGSSWPDDEAAIRYTLKLSIERTDNLLSIIVPHEPSESHVAKLLAMFPLNAIRLSEIENYKREPVIVVDSIGKLFGLYLHADIAMIGGGFSAGVHNVLEAAVWGVPVIMGPKHQRSIEVGGLIERLAAFEIKSAEEFDFVFWRMVKDDDFRETAGKAAERFVLERQGATDRVVSAIRRLDQDRS